MMTVDGLEARFWSKVDRRQSDDCWPWMGARFVQGYGKLFSHREHGRSRFHKAHRLSWEIAHGQEIPQGSFILHACDNPCCVNPAHLRVGDAADNAADRSERRRGKEARQCGVANDNAKLTEADVRDIFAELWGGSPRSQVAIAAAYGVKQAQISRIKLRQGWRHLWDE